MDFVCYIQSRLQKGSVNLIFNLTEMDVLALSFQSIIMPVYNASPWLDECLQAITQQDFTGSMELSVFDDASTVSVFLHSHKRGHDSSKLTACSPFRMTPGRCWKVGGKGWRRGASRWRCLATHLHSLEEVSMVLGCWWDKKSHYFFIYNNNFMLIKLLSIYFLYF